MPEKQGHRYCCIAVFICVVQFVIGIAMYFGLRHNLQRDVSISCACNQIKDSTNSSDVRIVRAQRHTQEEIEPLLYSKAAFTSYEESGNGHIAGWDIISETSIQRGFIVQTKVGEFVLKKTGYYDILVNLYWRKVNCPQSVGNYLYFCLNVNENNIACSSMRNNDTNGSFTLSLTSPRSHLFSAGDKVKVVMNPCGNCISKEKELSNIEIVYRRYH